MPTKDVPEVYLFSTAPSLSEFEILRATQRGEMQIHWPHPAQVGESQGSEFTPSLRDCAGLWPESRAFPSEQIYWWSREGAWLRLSGSVWDREDALGEIKGIGQWGQVRRARVPFISVHPT